VRVTASMHHIARVVKTYYVLCMHSFNPRLTSESASLTHWTN